MTFFGMYIILLQLVFLLNTSIKVEFELVTLENPSTSPRKKWQSPSLHVLPHFSQVYPQHFFFLNLTRVVNIVGSTLAAFSLGFQLHDPRPQMHRIPSNTQFQHLRHRPWDCSNAHFFAERGIRSVAAVPLE